MGISFQIGLKIPKPLNSSLDPEERHEILDSHKSLLEQV